MTFAYSWCFFSAKCGSSVSAKFLFYGAHTVCFLPLATILDPRWVDFEKNLLGGFGHKDLALRKSFRGNSLLPFYIRFLKMCVAIPTIGLFQCESLLNSVLSLKDVRVVMPFSG
jgi:hypothetical protein